MQLYKEQRALQSDIKDWRKNASHYKSSKAVAAAKVDTTSCKDFWYIVLPLINDFLKLYSFYIINMYLFHDIKIRKQKEFVKEHFTKNAKILVTFPKINL